MKTKFIIALMAISMMSCGNNQKPAETPEEEAQEVETLSLNGKWRLQDYAGETEMCSMDSTQNYYLQFNEADHTFGMTTDCNSLGGEYKLAEDSLTFDNIACTQMACPDEAVEKAMIAMLPRIDTYAIRPDSVLMLRSDMRIMATFSYVPEEAAGADTAE